MSDRIQNLVPAGGTTNRLNGHGDVTPLLAAGPRLRQGGAPEVSDVTFSFVPLTDAAPFIVAVAKGWFQEQGLNAKLRRESSWTALRDSLNNGTAHAAQMLFGMPVAAGCGLLGANQKRLIVPWVLSRNGQGITMRSGYQGQVAGGAAALRALAMEKRDAGRPLVFGHTLRIGTHAMWLRYWLAAGGIDPVKDVALITVPPPQMVANMRMGRMDGYCVGEPWNARAIADVLGYTAVTSQEIWPDHPEKVCAFTEEFAVENPRTVVAVLKALHRAGEWLDDSKNYAEAAKILSQPEHLNCPPESIQSRLGTAIDYGDGRKKILDHGVSFAAPGMNRPRLSQAIWFLTQLRRWGLHFGEPDYHGVSNNVIAWQFYEQAMVELGIQETTAPDAPQTFFDGTVFDPSQPAAYVQGFKLKHLQN
jgi:nitrate/nitrite transport system substrate-binding protein